MEIEKVIEKLIKETPNDMELGKKIRVLINKHNNEKKPRINNTESDGV